MRYHSPPYSLNFRVRTRLSSRLLILEKSDQNNLNMKCQWFSVSSSSGMKVYIRMTGVIYYRRDQRRGLVPVNGYSSNLS